VRAHTSCLFAQFGVQILDEFNTEFLSHWGKLIKVLLVLLLVLDLGLNT
jgi:hypothetical protein